MSLEEGVENVFDRIPLQSSIFKRREVVRFDYVPSQLPYRDAEIMKMALILSSIFREAVPSNIFIYGKTGTGKTAVSMFVKDQLIKKANQLKKPVIVNYINCRISDTSYRILTQLTRFLDPKVPFIGLPYDEIYERFISKLAEHNLFFVVFLDEIDQLAGKGDDKILYSLIRINSELSNGGLSIVGITNDLKFKETLDPRIVSALSDEEIFFEPYNAEQLLRILKDRAEEAFVDGAIDDSILQVIAAYAAREGGDARTAIDLLRLAGELAEREGDVKVKMRHVERARVKMKDDLFYRAITTLSLQSKLVLYSIALLTKINEEVITTGKVYSTYSRICEKINVDKLSKRRVSDIIRELDMIGLISYRIGHVARGRTKKIHLEYNHKKILELLNETI